MTSLTCCPCDSNWTAMTREIESLRKYLKQRGGTTSSPSMDSEYRAQVRMWTVLIILMLVLLLLVAVGCAFYYRGKMHPRRPASPDDDINGVFNDE